MCRKCKNKQKMENIEHYTTAKNKNMIKMNCVNCKSKIHRFGKKPVVEKEENDVVVLKELKVV